MSSGGYLHFIFLLITYFLIQKKGFISHFLIKSNRDPSFSLHWPHWDVPNPNLWSGRKTCTTATPNTAVVSCLTQHEHENGEKLRESVQRELQGRKIITSLFRMDFFSKERRYSPCSVMAWRQLSAYTSAAVGSDALRRLSGQTTALTGRVEEIYSFAPVRLGEWGPRGAKPNRTSNWEWFSCTWLPQLCEHSSDLNTWCTTQRHLWTPTTWRRLVTRFIAYTVTDRLKRSSYPSLTSQDVWLFPEVTLWDLSNVLLEQSQTI